MSVFRLGYFIQTASCEEYKSQDLRNEEVSGTKPCDHVPLSNGTFPTF